MENDRAPGHLEWKKPIQRPQSKAGQSSSVECTHLWRRSLDPLQIRWEQDHGSRNVDLEENVRCQLEREKNKCQHSQWAWCQKGIAGKDNDSKTGFGHIMRGSGSPLTLQIVEGMVEGKRKRGRQKKSWFDRGGGTPISNGYGCKAHTSKGWGIWWEHSLKKWGVIRWEAKFWFKISRHWVRMFLLIFQWAL